MLSGMPAVRPSARSCAEHFRATPALHFVGLREQAAFDACCAVVAYMPLVSLFLPSVCASLVFFAVPVLSARVCVCVTSGLLFGAFARRSSVLVLSGVPAVRPAPGLVLLVCALRLCLRAGGGMSCFDPGLGFDARGLISECSVPSVMRGAVILMRIAPRMACRAFRVCAALQFCCAAHQCDAGRINLMQGASI